MSNKVCIPVDIIRNQNLSPRARLIWAELSLLPKGVIGEFVINQKELSQQLGICVSTLRRALKSLEENKLIQFVGLFAKKYKKYIFKGVEAVIPAQAGIQILESTPNTGNLDASLRWHDKAKPVAVPNDCHSGLGTESRISWIPERVRNDKNIDCHVVNTPRSEEPAPAPTNNVIDGKFLLANWQQLYKEKSAAKVVAIKPREEKSDGSYRLKYPFTNGKPNSDEKCSMIYAGSICKLFQEKWREQFPLLNGHDKRPLLNYDLIELIVLSHPASLGGQKMLDVIEADLQKYTDGTF